MGRHALEVYRLLIKLDEIVRKGIDPTLLGLVKIRASQIDRCAFCLDMHTKDTLAACESFGVHGEVGLPADQ